MAKSQPYELESQQRQECDLLADVVYESDALVEVESCRGCIRLQSGPIDLGLKMGVAHQACWRHDPS